MSISCVERALSQADDLHLNRMIADLNRAIPGLNLSASQIQRVMSGILPVRMPGLATIRTGSWRTV